MEDNKTRSRIAIIMILSFVLIMGFVIIFPFISELADLSGNNEVIIRYLDKTASLFSGIIGIIIGYYFGYKNTIENK